MWQEGQEDKDLFDDVPESFILCALHQAKIIRERWKFWSGTVPTDVSIRLHRLESILSMNDEIREIENNQISEISLKQISNINSSQPFLPDNPTVEKYFIQPQHNIIIQGPDIQRIVKDKHRIHFLWCCY